MEVSLKYPFDGKLLLKKKKSIKRGLLADGTTRVKKRIAVLGGSTTSDIIAMLELFLLDQGIEPSFYECEYNKYWEELMFPNPELEQFAPDVIFIHTSYRNLSQLPQLSDTPADVEALLDSTFNRFQQMWENAAQTYHCAIVQNNFDQPFYRLLGNRDAYDHRGRVDFVNRLNVRFADYARAHDGFYLNDLNWISAQYGLAEWQDPFYWHMFKYAVAVPAIPEFAFNVANIIKSIFGKNKKALVLDLDNTLWGGIVGDDGPENIEIGQETAQGQVFSEFQRYVRELKDMGVMLNIDSKNEMENALAGLERPDGVLKPDDFIIIKANWDPKDLNLRQIAQELNVGIDSLVFVDDNPAEREIIRQGVPDAAVPEVGEAHRFVTTLDRSGFFEATTLSDDDMKRGDMYKANLKRSEAQASYADYGEYLKSLEMTAEIAPFSALYESRIAQLTNKTNQFNLTTRRCTLAEIQDAAADPDYVTLYGKLEDKFGDNGVVAVTFGHVEGDTLDIDLWLMSCRVLKRDMECALMDRVVAECRERGVKRIVGHYYPTAKNKMVKEFFGQFGFVKTSEDDEGNAEWALEDLDAYEPKNNVISVREASE